MARKTYAENIKDAEVMSAGLSNNTERAERRGMNRDFIEELKSKLRDAINLNNQQEKLKADLKQKTAELDDKMKLLNTQMSQARRLVKVEFPQAQWKEFGVEAKR